MAHYIHDENHNRIEAYSAEEVLSILEQAIEDGDLEHITPDSGFITKFKNKADGQTYGIAFCTQAQYNEMEQGGTLETNVIYYITDDDSYSDLQELIESLQEDVDTAQSDISDLADLINNIINGTTTVPKATEANRTKNALTIYLSDGTTRTFDGSSAQGIVIDDLMGMDDARDRTFVVGDEGFISFKDTAVGRFCLGYFYIQSLSQPIYLGEFNGVNYRINTSGKLEQKVNGDWVTIGSSIWVSVRWIHKG